MKDYSDEYYGDCEVCGTWCPPDEDTKPWRYLCNICKEKGFKFPRMVKQNEACCCDFFNPGKRYADIIKEKD